MVERKIFIMFVDAAVTKSVQFHYHNLMHTLHPQPTQVSVLREKKIVYAAAGVSHSIFIDSSGAVFTCGKGKGLLGHGNSKIKTVPTKIQSLEVSIILIL